MAGIVKFTESSDLGTEIVAPPCPFDSPAEACLCNSYPIVVCVPGCCFR